MLDNLILIFGFIEVLFVLGAIYCVLEKSGYRVSEALAISILLLLTYLSFIFQTAFILSIPKFSYLVEIPITIYSIRLCFLNPESFKRICVGTKIIFRESRFITCILLMGIGYLFLQSVVLKPNNVDSLVYNLSRVLLFQQENTLFLEHVNLYHQAVLPIGNDILYHLFLRSYQEYGLALFAWLSFIGIGCSGWALTTNYYSRKIALISVLLILSMPQIIYATTTPKNDLVLGFIASLILLLSSKVLKDLEIDRVLLICIALSFGLGAKTTFASFILFYIPIFLFFLIRSHTFKSVFQIFWAHRLLLVIISIPCLVLAQVYLFAWNHIHWGGFSGPSEYVHTVKNHDGVLGTVSNAVRYFLQSFHFPALIDSYLVKFFGISVPEKLQSLYDQWLLPLCSNFGITNYRYNFQIQWEQTEDSWFGPFGFIFLLLLPLFILKGNTVTKLAAVVLAFTFMLICYKLAWTPMKDRYFALIFGASTMFAAFLVSHIIDRKFIVKAITGYAIFSFFFAITFNITKPTFYFFSPRIDQMFVSSFVNGHNVWSFTQMGKERFWEHPDVSKFLNHIPPSRIGIFQAGHREVYPYLISRPDCHFIPMERIIDNEHALKITYPSQLDEELDYVLILENQFTIETNHLYINNQSIKSKKELTLVRQIELGKVRQSNRRLVSLISVG
jgi:hypothetical protein